MPGSSNILIGLGIFVVGTLVTLGSYAVAPGGYFVVAYGAIFVGGIQALIGLFQFLAYQAKSPESKRQHHARIGARVITRSMVAVATADGTLGKGEISVILAITETMFGSPISEAAILTVFESIKNKPEDFLSEIQSIGRQVTNEDARLLVLSCGMVAFSDRSASEEEKKMLSQICSYLPLRQDEVAELFAEARKKMEALFSGEL